MSRTQGFQRKKKLKHFIIINTKWNVSWYGYIESDIDWKSVCTLFRCGDMGAGGGAYLRIYCLCKILVKVMGWVHDRWRCLIYINGCIFWFKQLGTHFEKTSQFHVQNPLTWAFFMKKITMHLIIQNFQGFAKFWKFGVLFTAKSQQIDTLFQKNH